MKQNKKTVVACADVMAFLNMNQLTLTIQNCPSLTKVISKYFIETTLGFFIIEYRMPNKTGTQNSSQLFLVTRMDTFTHLLASVGMQKLSIKV